MYLRASAVNFSIPTADKCRFAGARGWLVVRLPAGVFQLAHVRHFALEVLADLGKEGAWVLYFQTLIHND